MGKPSGLNPFIVDKEAGYPDDLMRQNMENKWIERSSQSEFFSIILFALICTFIMSFLEAFERLYMFTKTFEHYQFGEFAVFFPSFLAIGFTYFSYRQIQKLESEVTKRLKAEKALRKSEQKYRDLSITDDLTLLYNSRHFYHKIASEIDRANRYNRPLSAILLDIDDFKHYNDKYGHLEGDKVLISLGKVIRECLRITDSAYRYGGEEFTVILPETEGEEAIAVSERIRKKFEAEIFSPRPNERVNKTVSIGASQYEPKEEMRTFITRTDKAMYVAKGRGKNQVFFL